MAVSEIAEHRYERSGLVFLTRAQRVKKDWYEWSIELEKAPVALTKIRQVEYILHPTFADRIRRLKSADNKFRLESEGWGEFDIVVNVYYKNDEEQIAVVPLKLG